MLASSTPWSPTAAPSTASRALAVLSFWALPTLGLVGASTLFSLAPDAYDGTVGQSAPLQDWVAHSIFPTNLAAAVFALILARTAPIAIGSARRLYAGSAILGVVSYAVSLALALSLASTFRSPAVYVLTPVFVAFLLSSACLSTLVRVGWLAHPTPGVCPRCGYSLISSASRRCPECGHFIAA